MEVSKNRGNQIVDHLSSTEGIPEQGELLEWIDGSDKNKGDFKKYQGIWKGTEKLAEANKFQTDKAWPVVNRQIQRTQLYRRRIDRVVFSAIGLAASLFLILGLAFYTGQFSIKQNKMQLATNYGSRTEVILPDGSKVKLNSGSSLSYHFNSLTKTREVSFVGEGFFEVAKDQQPFVIHTTNGMDLKVLGTTFNLSAYPEDQLVQTALVDGKVELSNEHNEKLILASGQIAKFEKNSQILARQNGNLSHMVGWTQNKIYLDNTSLKETSIRLERWFDVDIDIVPENLGDEIHYTGVLEERTIQDVLNALSELSDIDYSINGRGIRIAKR